MDNRTTDFTQLNLPKGRVFAILGINHPTIGKCEFINLMATSAEKPERVGHTFNYSSAQLEGSGE